MVSDARRGSGFFLHDKRLVFKPTGGPNLYPRRALPRGVAAKPHTKPPNSAKAPRSHIVRQEGEDAFLKEVADYMERGFRPIQDMKMFAAFDRKQGRWHTLYLMPLVHFEELKAFQTIPTSDEEKEERMFG